MKRKIKIALIGCGNWGKNILRDLKKLNCEVIVVSESENSIQNAKEGKADNIFMNISELINIDGAVVAVNTLSHYKVINEILKIHSSIPIFSEKPLCVDVDQAFELYKKASSNLFVMDKWRYHQGIIELTKFVKEQRFGNIKGIKLNRNGWGNPHKDVNCIWILLPHDLSIILEILGYIPEAKYALYDKTRNGIQGMTGLLLDEKHWVSFEISERYAGYKREIIVYFDDGIIQLTNSNKDNIELFYTTKDYLIKKPNLQLIAFDNEMPLYRELKSFTNYIKGIEGPPKSSAYDGYQIVKKIQDLIDIANN